MKVTSFPSRATVWVDGVNTGKTTPMSVSLTEGEHAVTVSLPNSGWNPDTRTVTIVTGNNDLSVTLLPVLTAGAQGPKGEKGEKGDKGDPGEAGQQGAPGNLALGGQMCPSGRFVVGFDLAGQLVCRTPDWSSSPPVSIALPQGQLIEDVLKCLTGTEANGRLQPFSAAVANLHIGIGINVVGFAFCVPPDPLVPPSPTSPAFPCAPELEVTLNANSTNQATLTVDIEHLFVSVSGTWSISNTNPPVSNTVNGFVVLSGARMQFSVALVDTGNGLTSFGPGSLTSLSYTLPPSLTMDFHDPLLNVTVVPGEFEGLFLGYLRFHLNTVSPQLVSAALAAMPPLTLP